jgi:hypothetical protein
MEIITQETDTDVIVIAGTGFYTFLLATVSSLIVGHVILHFHRCTAVQSLEEMDKQKQLQNYIPSIARSLFNILMLLVCLGLMITGAIIYTFRYPFLRLESPLVILSIVVH